MVSTEFRLVFLKSALNEGWSMHKLIILDNHTDILSLFESSCFCYEKKLSWIALSVIFLYQETVVIVHLENNKLQYQISLNIIWICDGTSCADCYIAWAEVLSIAVLLLLQERAISWRNHFLLTFRITGCLRRIRFHLTKHWFRFS